MSKGLEKETGNEEIQILTFIINGVKLGVETAQVEEVMEAEESGKAGTGLHEIMCWSASGGRWKDMTAISFDERIPFCGGPVKYASPKVLLVKDKDTPYGIVIDNLSEIISVNLNSVYPLPPLIAKGRGAKAVWGVALDKAELIMLVDFYR